MRRMLQRLQDLREPKAFPLQQRYPFADLIALHRYPSDNRSSSLLTGFYAERPTKFMHPFPHATHSYALSKAIRKSYAIVGNFQSEVFAVRGGGNSDVQSFRVFVNIRKRFLNDAKQRGLANAI